MCPLFSLKTLQLHQLLLQLHDEVGCCTIHTPSRPDSPGSQEGYLLQINSKKDPNNFMKNNENDSKIPTVEVLASQK